MPHAPFLERFTGSGNSSLQIAITRMPCAIQHVCCLTRSHGTRACGGMPPDLQTRTRSGYCGDGEMVSRESSPTDKSFTCFSSPTFGLEQYLQIVYHNTSKTTPIVLPQSDALQRGIWSLHLCSYLVGFVSKSTQEASRYALLCLTISLSTYSFVWIYSSPGSFLSVF
jgi:hypothetical protein